VISGAKDWGTWIGRFLLTGLLCGALVNCEPIIASGIKIAISPTPATVGIARVIVTFDSTVASVTALTLQGRLRTGNEAGLNEGGLVLKVAVAQSTSVWVVDSFPFATPGTWRLVATAQAAGAIIADSADFLVIGGMNP